jgi:hypothetical protein
VNHACRGRKLARAACRAPPRAAQFDSVQRALHHFLGWLAVGFAFSFFGFRFSFVGRI